jgi:hypothetical protein
MVYSAPMVRIFQVIDAVLGSAFLLLLVLSTIAELRKQANW